jgi:AcrR family transcriptional regulator
MTAEISTEEKILIAAKKIFLKKGWDGARMQDIANEAGINKALLHYYFRNKEKLFTNVFSGFIGKLVPNINKIIDSEIHLFQKIEAIIEAYINFLMENPEIPLFVANELSKNPDLIIGVIQKNGDVPLFKSLALEIMQAIEKGEIRPITPIHLLINIVSMCVFPFIGKPIIQNILVDIPDALFQELLLQRKKEVYQTIILSLTNTSGLNK